MTAYDVLKTVQHPLGIMNAYNMIADFANDDFLVGFVCAIAMLVCASWRFEND